MSRENHSPAFLLYANDFVSNAKVEAMTTREVGAYFLLLRKAWYETPVGTITTDERILARWARLTPEKWAECRDAVLAAFKPYPENRPLSPRFYRRAAIFLRFFHQARQAAGGPGGFARAAAIPRRESALRAPDGNTAPGKRRGMAGKNTEFSRKKPPFDLTIRNRAYHRSIDGRNAKKIENDNDRNTNRNS